MRARNRGGASSLSQEAWAAAALCAPGTLKRSVLERQEQIAKACSGTPLAAGMQMSPSAAGALSGQLQETGPEAERLTIVR